MIFGLKVHLKQIFMYVPYETLYLHTNLQMSKMIFKQIYTRVVFSLYKLEDKI